MIVVLLVTGVLFAAGRRGPQTETVLTREQQQRRQQTQQALDERGRLQQQAKQAFDAEMTRAARNSECPDAHSTREQEECLQKESNTTQANYKKFTTALRSLIVPAGNEEQPAVGPEGAAQTSAQAAGEFDSMEQAWQQYREKLCSAAFHEGGGGTIAPVLEGECEIRSLRNHMRDLEQTYALLLSVR